MRLVRTAPAKVNLALHVVGQRADGYHLLDTLVAFARVGDMITVEPDDTLGLTVHGPFCETLQSDAEANLVLRAARLLADEALRLGRWPTGRRVGARIHLDKHLPIASGVGGGSADAAATLLALDALWQLDLGRDRLAALGLTLGADVPMCLAGETARVTGIGEHVAPGPALPDHGLLLVNPCVPVSTPAVFRALVRRDLPPLPDLPMAWDGLDHLAGWLAGTRNDLQPPAEAIAPAVREVMGVLSELAGCRFARMSGSGATCFGLFASADEAAAAGRAVAAARPDWWVG